MVASVRREKQEIRPVRITGLPSLLGGRFYFPQCQRLDLGPLPHRPAAPSPHPHSQTAWPAPRAQRAVQLPTAPPLAPATRRTLPQPPSVRRRDEALETATPPVMFSSSLAASQMRESNSPSEPIARPNEESGLPAIALTLHPGGKNSIPQDGQRAYRRFSFSFSCCPPHGSVGAAQVPRHTSPSVGHTGGTRVALRSPHSNQPPHWPRRHPPTSAPVVDPGVRPALLRIHSKSLADAAIATPSSRTESQQPALPSLVKIGVHPDPPDCFINDAPKFIPTTHLPSKNLTHTPGCVSGHPVPTTVL